MQTRPVLAFYVDAEGAMVGVKVDGLGVTAADGVPTIRIPSAIDSKSGVSTDSIAAGAGQPTVADLRPVELRFASQCELIDARGSGSTADWVDSQLAVQSAPVLLKGFGVQTDARVGPVHADRMVDRATSPVSTSVGDYGPVSAWTQTREEVVKELRVPEESVSVGVRDRMRPASVQASLIAVPVVEAAQHVLLQMASDVSQTVDVYGRDRVPLRLTDVEVSYVCPVGDGAERIVSAIGAPKPVAISPPVVEASTMSMQSAVGPTPLRPGHCSLCGQRVPSSPDKPREPFITLPFEECDARGSITALVTSCVSVRCLLSPSVVLDSSSYVVVADGAPSAGLFDSVGSTSFLPGYSAVECGHLKHFSSQFTYFPDQSDVYSQAVLPCCDSSCGTEMVALKSASTCCDDLPGATRVLFQNLSVTDYRDRLVEHHYYAPARENLLVADCATQFSATPDVSGHLRGSTDELLFARQRLSEVFSVDVYNAGVAFGVFAEKTCATDFSVEEVVPVHSLELRAQVPLAAASNEMSTQTSDYVDLQLLLSHFDVAEVWEAVRSVTSDYDYYQTLRQNSIVREQTCTTDEEPPLLADIGIQVDMTSFIVRESSSSPDIYSVTSEVESTTYESYLLRSRLGQVREEQTYMAPLVNQASTQTEAVSFSLFSEFKSEGGVYESTETYDYRLLRDEIAEAWTQWDTDFDENEIDDLNKEDADNLTEESYLEVVNKRRKKVYSQVEITEETDMIVCELGVQVDPDYFTGDTADSLTKKTPVKQTDEELQTDPIHLDSIQYSTDLSWADPNLYAVILAGIDASRIRAHEDSRIWFGNETAGAKMLITIGCQTSPVKHLISTKEMSHWTEVSTTNQPLCERSMAELDSFVDKEIFVRPLSPESIQASDYSELATMIVQLRQRTVQYELLETGTQLLETEWNNIREVASPSTGLFAPVALAIRRGWIRLGERNEYIDPTTGDAIPLATAYQMGRIRLASTQTSLGRTAEPSIPILLLIERTYFSWRKTKLVSVEDTARGDVLTPEAAIQTGILEVTGSEIRFLDTMTNTWLTIEEGVGRQMIQVVAVESSAESTSSEEEEPSTCRVFQLTHIRPGGEPCVWMAPLEAVRLGLFNWETGDVAADWPTRPLLRHLDPTGEIPTTAFVPSKWCSFLTAKHAGWLRLTEEEPSKWIVTHSVPYQEPNAVLLSRQINLVAYASTPVEAASDGVDHGMVSLQRARSDDVFATTTPSTSEKPIRMHCLSDAFSSMRSRSDYQVRAYELPSERSDTELESYTIHRRQVQRRHLPATKHRYYSGENPTSSDSVSPTRR